MTGEPLFLGFFDTADNMAIGDGNTQFGKVEPADLELVPV